MSFEDMLNHRCAIYHLKSTPEDMGYNITSNKFAYKEKPDLTDIPCHFNINDTGNMNQTEDANEYIVVRKLQLPLETEIYINDKVVNMDNGMEYIAEIPKKVRNHHIIVNIQRKGKLKGAI